jgi:hypothetical protein
MRRPGRPPRPLLCGLLAVLAWLLTASPLWACTDRASVWDWDRCWVSLTRWLVLLGLASGWWFLCFHRLFPYWLAPARRDAPLPSVAFRRCLALFWGLSCLTFLLLFAALGDELAGGGRSFPSSAGWFSRNWRWLLALLIGAVGALVIWAPRRRAVGSRQ